MWKTPSRVIARMTTTGPVPTVYNHPAQVSRRKTLLSQTSTPEREPEPTHSQPPSHRPAGQALGHRSKEQKAARQATPSFLESWTPSGVRTRGCWQAISIARGVLSVFRKVRAVCHEKSLQDMFHVDPAQLRCAPQHGHFRAPLLVCAALHPLQAQVLIINVPQIRQLSHQQRDRQAEIRLHCRCCCSIRDLCLELGAVVITGDSTKGSERELYPGGSDGQRRFSPLEVAFKLRVRLVAHLGVTPLWVPAMSATVTNGLKFLTSQLIHMLAVPPHVAAGNALGGENLPWQPSLFVTLRDPSIGLSVTFVATFQTGRPAVRPSRCVSQRLRPLTRSVLQSAWFFFAAF